MEIQGKRGDIHPITGKIFWKRDKNAKGGIWWVTPEKYQSLLMTQKVQNEKWYDKNEEHHRTKTSQWYADNKDRIRVYQSQPLIKASRKIRSRMLEAIALKRFTPSIETLIGCDFTSFKLHIESKFKKGMNWSNHGKWHFDHIKPFSSANTIDEIKALAHHSNIQPLWAKENRKKHNSV